MRLKRSAASIGLCGVLLVGSACGGAPSAPTSSAAPASYQPVTVSNCGREVAFTRPPSRVVTTGQEATELLLALGLAGRVAGISRTFNEPPEHLKADFAKLRTLAPDKVAPKEVMLAARPDLVLAAYLDFDLDPSAGLASRADLAAAGAQVLGLSVNCAKDPASTTIEDTYRDILDIGRVFSVTSRAEQLVAEMRKKITDAQAKIAGRPRPKVLAYANGEGPIGVSGAGLATDLIRLAGGDNVFADLKEGFGRVAVEAAAARTPEVFVVNYYQPGPTPEEKVAFLRKALPNSGAARNNRSVAIADAAMNSGIRNADAVVHLAEGFFPDAFR